jgi:hypothetical protein
MSTTEKIKRIILISIGFGLATYLIMSGSAILSQESDTTQTEVIDANNTAQ